MNLSKQQQEQGAKIDDAQGMEWWNGLTEAERAEAIRATSDTLGRPASPADAWHTRKGGRFDPRTDEGYVMQGADRARGVGVMIGAAVLGSHGEGHVIAMTEKLCIYLDRKGDEIAETWASIHVQASGPATRDNPGQAGQAGTVSADPFYDLAGELERFAAKLDQAHAAWDLHLTDPHGDKVSEAINTILDDLYETSRTHRGEWIKGELPSVNATPATGQQQEKTQAPRRPNGSRAA